MRLLLILVLLVAALAPLPAVAAAGEAGSAMQPCHAMAADGTAERADADGSDADERRRGALPDAAATGAQIHVCPGCALVTAGGAVEPMPVRQPLLRTLFAPSPLLSLLAAPALPPPRLA